MNYYERKLLIGARNRIEFGDEQFICCAIEASHSVQSDALDVVRLKIMLDLKRSIQHAIDGKYTFECYIYSTYGIRPERVEGRVDHWDEYDTFAKEIIYFASAKFANFARQARLAWIDRMLDDNEVK